MNNMLVSLDSDQGLIAAGAADRVSVRYSQSCAAPAVVVPVISVVSVQYRRIRGLLSSAPWRSWRRNSAVGRTRRAVAWAVRNGRVRRPAAVRCVRRPAAPRSAGFGDAGQECAFVADTGGVAPPELGCYRGGQRRRDEAVMGAPAITYGGQ